jgi:glycerol kinase
MVGLTRGVKREHLVRAALEAMCYSTRDVINTMEKDSNLKIKNLKVDGGAVENNFLCQFQADILGKAVVRPKITELTALGAAFLAGLGIKLWKDAAEIKHFWAIDKVFKPRLSKNEADRFYRGWLAAVARTLSK